ncbi:MAG: glycerophosphodiester phosphodiesterase [Gammaproteobacteria bacterium]|nr:glycerophosphodiester phosphodiesterase [Gammaproteobacteria bacterium]MDH3435145.1 glycerophosphodiester phosphodiesterase [Gammaproteobacteria bacterium]
MRPLVIAHRGASGYLPEHTLAAKGLAHEMGADYLEQDVVASRDDELIVLHDIYLDRVSDVAERFPDRARGDGRYYVRDFDLVELASLSIWERMNADGSPVYPERYPARSGDFRLNTLREELAFIRRLNEETGRQAGIYPEIKRPAWHRQQGVDIAPRLLEILADFGYQHAQDPVFLQCFDDVEVRRLRQELDCPFKLVQLIGNNSWGEADTDYDALRSAQGIRRLAETADAIGPHLSHLYEVRESDGELVPTGLAEQAHEAGLAVHPYTFRADELPPGFSSFAELVRYFAIEIGVDAMFTDFPDQILQLRLP